MSLSKKQLSFIVILLSLFVFLLALNAKLSLYEQPPHPNATSSSKMWLKGQKMEARALNVLVSALVGLAFLLVRPLPFRAAWPRTEFHIDPPSPLPAFELHRFLRPPPLA
jgi:hypothetical protein